jgi:hypothetical protein
MFCQKQLTVYLEKMAQYSDQRDFLEKMVRLEVMTVF